MHKYKRFNVGETFQAVKVRFPGQLNAGTFLLNHISYPYGQKVVAMSERGPAIGFVNSLPFEARYEEEIGKVFEIERAATAEDEMKLKEEYQKFRESKDIFNRLVSKYQLPMEFMDMDISGCGEKVTFMYLAPERVDFRELLKDLGRELKKKIELRQVPRPSSPQLIGPCGTELCTFINSMMKDGSKACNEFYCRLEHKDPFYEDKKSRLPKVGDYVALKSSEIGRVEKVDLWHEEFVALTDQGIRKRYTSEYFVEVLNKKKIDFPKYFENIVNETFHLVGAEELKQKKTVQLKQDEQHSAEVARQFSEEKFDQLFK